MFFELFVTFVITMTTLNATIPIVAGAIEMKNRKRRQYKLLSDEYLFEQSPLIEHHLVL